jgi:hypothetical protein
MAKTQQKPNYKKTFNKPTTEISHSTDTCQALINLAQRHQRPAAVE